MQFEQGYVYHIYNQGNNREQLFFNRENYLFFLRKMHKYLLPYCDVLAWCLMPNHFHWMVRVNAATATVGVTLSHADSSSSIASLRSFNDSIGILLRSYTRAINKQQNRSGKLIREKTKAECLDGENAITPAYFNTHSGTLINVEAPQKQYPQVCFNYIHQNPVDAGLVSRPGDWEFSSFLDYAGARDGKLINKALSEKYGLSP